LLFNILKCISANFEKNQKCCSSSFLDSNMEEKNWTTGHPIKFLSQIFLSINFLKSTPQDLSKMPKYLQIGWMGEKLWPFEDFPSTFFRSKHQFFKILKKIPKIFFSKHFKNSPNYNIYFFERNLRHEIWKCRKTVPKTLISRHMGHNWIFENLTEMCSMRSIH
jgi:hypothetical protein